MGDNESSNGKKAWAQLERWLGKIFLAGILGATITATTFLLDIHKELVQLREDAKALQNLNELTNKLSNDVNEMDKEFEIHRVVSEMKLFGRPIVSNNDQGNHSP